MEGSCREKVWSQPVIKNKTSWPRFLWRDTARRSGHRLPKGSLFESSTSGIRMDASWGARQSRADRAARPKKEASQKKPGHENYSKGSRNQGVKVSAARSARLRRAPKKASSRSALPIFWGDSLKESDRKPIRRAIERFPSGTRLKGMEFKTPWNLESLNLHRLFSS